MIRRHEVNAMGSSCTSNGAVADSTRAHGDEIACSCKNQQDIVKEPMRKFEIDRLPDHKDEAILAEIRRVAKLLNVSKMTIAEFNKHARIKAGGVRKHFGSWRATLEKAGLELSSPSGKRYTEDDCNAQPALYMFRL